MAQDSPEPACLLFGLLRNFMLKYTGKMQRQNVAKSHKTTISSGYRGRGISELAATVFSIPCHSANVISTRNIHNLVPKGSYLWADFKNIHSIALPDLHAFQFPVVFTILSPCYAIVLFPAPQTPVVAPAGGQLRILHVLYSLLHSHTFHHDPHRLFCGHLD